MPRIILTLIGLFFATTVLAQTTVALNRPASERTTLSWVVIRPLFAINAMGAVLTYCLIADRRWRAEWLAYQSNAPNSFDRLSRDSALSSPNETLTAISPEPGNVYLEQPFQDMIQWDKTRRGSNWLQRSDAEALLAVQVLRLLAGLKLHGAYIGRTFHDTDRVAVIFDATPVRALYARSRGTFQVYTFRLDREKQHMVVTFAIKRDGNTLTLGWHHATLRASWRDAIEYRALWILLSLLGAVVLPELLLITTLHAILLFPPSRGWTSLWAKMSRDRILNRFSGAGETLSEQMQRKAFETSVTAAFSKIASI